MPTQCNKNLLAQPFVSSFMDTALDSPLVRTQALAPGQPGENLSPWRHLAQ